jgi:DNA-binding GntR family transcriptional regulator
VVPLDRSQINQSDATTGADDGKDCNMALKNVFEKFGSPRSMVEDIADTLSEAIIEGEIEPGQQIIETDLQKALGVSRAPIREALLKLEGQGLVRMIPRKGTFVRTITPTFIKDSFAVRAWLEGLAARLTTENLKKPDFDDLERILIQMGRIADEGDFKAYFHRHADFHRFFIHNSRNQLLAERIEIMRREALWLSYSITYFEHHHVESQKTHRRILNLFRKGDADEVEVAVRSHILEATDSYVRFVKKTYPELSVLEEYL